MWSIKAREAFEFGFLYIYIYIYIFVCHIAFVFFFFFFFLQFLVGFTYLIITSYGIKNIIGTHSAWKNVDNFIEFVVECGWIWLQKLIGHVKKNL